ncbi:MAG TPA: 30S ribosomal protein S1 [Candidatus Latescibacteria bacterium]|nr:30S ribosomal protein S1 [Candidatus Latescibacterota bacterium]HOS65099.1 30S ribosomal protein S1 [Candidatus Latescibacterota bacterium]HPC44685.1 30S ribosomal protein S1 [Candidatus Latescibacterota bacterium]HPK74324.1 30S ribosomal protein S1 [Candidatus Latescibacterota bacterium]
MAEEQIIPSAAEPAPVEQPAADKAPVQATKEERTPARVKFVSDVNELPRDDEYASEEYEQLISKYESSFAVKEGEIVKGKVLRIENDEVIVDIGFKSEGSIKLAEFTDPSEAQVGNEIEVFVEEIEDQEGQVVVSKQKADFMRVWDRIKEAFDSGQPVAGTLTKRIKGGIVVDLFGVDAFLPGSQIDLRQVKNFEQYLGKTFDFRIIKLNKNRRNIVVSRRVLLEEERETMRDELLKTLEKDQIREGLVKNITDFGAFIDLGGVDGLLHITDMSWGRINHPSEVVKIGDHIRVKVLNYDKERGRISLGLKQLAQYPWKGVQERYPVNSRVKGRVVSITDYGAFVELEEGVEGLIHVSEMSWTQHVRHPSKVLNIGDEVEALVLRVDEANEKISLGLKQTQPDPWETLDERYPVGTKLIGKVRNITNFGAFVEIEEGIDGLVHISDLSWTKRIKHPSEVVKKGDDLPVVVLNIDKEQRRISLSHKHCEENPWDSLEAQYQPGVQTSGVISRVTDKGVVVDLEGDVEGFIPVSQLGIEDMRTPEEHFSPGETLNMVVVEFDREQKRIVLSVKRYLEHQSEEELKEYLAAHVQRPITIADAVEAKGEDFPEAAEGATEEPVDAVHDDEPADREDATPASSDEQSEG